MKCGQRCCLTQLGIEIFSPQWPKRLGYMRPITNRKYEKNNPIKHVMVKWDGAKDWESYNVKYIREA